MTSQECSLTLALFVDLNVRITRRAKLASNLCAGTESEDRPPTIAAI